MKFLHTADRERYKRLTTSELREAYLIDDMFVPGELTLCYTDVDRSIVGSAVPTGKALELPVHDANAFDLTTIDAIGDVGVG